MQKLEVCVRFWQFEIVLFASNIKLRNLELFYIKLFYILNKKNITGISFHTCKSLTGTTSFVCKNIQMLSQAEATKCNINNHSPLKLLGCLSEGTGRDVH